MTCFLQRDRALTLVLMALAVPQRPFLAVSVASPAVMYPQSKSYLTSQGAPKPAWQPRLHHSESELLELQ